MDEKNKSEEYEINLEGVIKFLKRNTKFLGLFSGFGLLITSYFIINSKKIWHGQFQIVIEKDQPSLVRNNNSGGSGVQLLFNQISNSNSSLKTEVEILKSPFVLLNIYSFILNFDQSYKENNVPFSDWRKQIDVKFTEGTSVLNITYQDLNKQNIIPVLEAISKKYQNYSGSQRQRDIELSLNYFRNQIDIFKKQSVLSQKKYIDFAEKYNLLYVASAINMNPQSSVKNMNPILNIESARVKEATKISRINELIERITKDKERPESLIYLSKIIKNNFSNKERSNSKINEEIMDINSDLISLRRIYNENDKSIEDLKKLKKDLSKLLYQDTLGILKAQREDSEANLKSLERPLGVISKFKELLRNAAKDEIILSSLEDQYRVYSLESAKNKDPWKLITKPTLDPYPLPAYKLRKLLLGLIAGFSLGSMIALFREKKEDKIFSEKDINQIFNDVKINTFKRSEKENWEENINIMSIGFLGSIEKNLKVLLLDIKEDSEIIFFKKLLKDSLKKTNLSITESVVEALKEKELIILIKASISTKNKLNKIYNNLITQNKKVIGIIFIDD